MSIVGKLTAWAWVVITVGGLTLWLSLLIYAAEAIDRMTSIMPPRRK